MTMQLYLHFPFCKQKCYYCDFCSAPGGEEEMAAYAASLAQEIRLAAKTYGHAEISTVFLGGGTPSIMPEAAMEGIWTALEEGFSFAKDLECTVEANPGTLTNAWLAQAQSHGVNRLSLGVQAAQDKHLKALGRIHTFDQAREALELARGQGISNINMDVMFGLPGQSLMDYMETLEAVAALGPEHISAYSLILEEGTPLFAMVAGGQRPPLPAEDEVAEMYEQGRDWLAAQGYGQYEISNFAQPGFACRHNLGYWQGAWYLGLGLGAHSMLPMTQEGADGDRAYLRVENTADRKAYREMLTAGLLPVESATPIAPKEAMFETMMLGLRTTAGVSLRDFMRRHGKPLEAVYGSELEALLREGLGAWREDEAQGRRERSFTLTPKGLLLENTVLMRFMG